MPSRKSYNVTFAVSPDGKQIAFSAADENLYLLDLKTQRVTRLTQTGRCGYPAFSPDGTKIIYCAIASETAGYGLYELHLTRKTTRRLTSGINTSDTQPSYSPDGSRILFTRSLRNGAGRLGRNDWSGVTLWLMQADGTSARPVTPQTSRSVGRPCFSRDGKTIIYSADLPYDSQFFDKNHGGSLPTIVQISVGVSGAPKILLPLPKRGKQGGSNGSDPDLSPSGRQIAFISDRATPFAYDICLMDPNGSNLRSLHVTKTSLYNQQPTYMPDGKSLLFLAGTETGAGNRPVFSLWQINVDGSNARQVADETLFLEPARWQPRSPEPKDARSVNAALSQGTSPNKRDAMGRSLLSNAAARGDANTVRLLLEKGADPNAPDADGSTVLTRALEKDSLDVARLLVDKGADVNAAPKGGSLGGMPPLIIAALGSKPEIVALLLQAGAEVKATDPQLGGTALHWACDSGNTAIAKLLLSKGSPVDARNSMGGTPLMGAAMAGQADLVKFLIEKGANVRARDDKSRQMFGAAQFNGDTKSAEAIRQSGKLDSLHEDGRSVLDWARIGGSPAVIALLQKAGATQ